MDGNPRILLVVGGGIAAYKACELVRLIRKGAGGVGGEVTCVLTEGGSQFVTPMSLAALSGNPVHTSLWDLKNEVEMGHIQLSREADLVVVCPATADLMAKMAAGIADDLGTTLILATDKPVMVVPAMNVRMWEHQATQRNVEWLKQAGVHVMMPDAGEMACGEFGLGRLPEPEMVWLEIAELLGLDPGDAGAAQVADYLEALEPEEEGDFEDEEFDEYDDEDEAPRRGGLSGLLASIIPRAMPRRVRDEEVEFDEDFDGAIAGDPASDPAELPPQEKLPRGIAVEEFLHEEFPPAEFIPGDLPPDEPVFDPNLSSPLLAKKGKANAAPPTDPEALNHMVKTGSATAAPEPIAGDVGMPSVAGGAVAGGAVAGGAEAGAERVPVMAKMAPPMPYVAEELLDGQPDFDIDPEHRPLYGRHVLITAGPTWESIDPVRYLANRSSGKQGFSIAAAAAALGARVTLVAGPVHLATPPGVDRIDVESAREMASAVKKGLPADVAVMVAAVADWRSKDVAHDKIKKRGSAPPALQLTENPDILATTAGSEKRPRLLIGFAAETEHVIENAKKKRKSKGVDWIVANDVADDVMGGAENEVHIVSNDGVESWEMMPKEEVALKLMERIADALDAKAD